MTKMPRPERFPLRTSFLALLTLLPVWAGASSFEKAYTESMIVSDGTTIAEAKLALLDKIRLDALNDTGARLKNTTTLTRNGDTESDPTSIFSKTMVSLIHIGQTKYASNMNAYGQTELKATAVVSVDDTELQKADEKERLVVQQQQHVKQLEDLVLQQQRTVEQLRDQLLAKPPRVNSLVLPDGLSANNLAPNQKVQTHLPSVSEIVGEDRIIKGINSANSAPSPLLLTEEERNNNTLTPAQQVRFDQLCERFKAIDKMILDDGVQTAYLGTKDIEKYNDAFYKIHYAIRATWDWTAEMKAIRHLMGDAGTIGDNTYILDGSDINDKALLVAVRKCERADRFMVIQDETVYFNYGPFDEVHHIFSYTEEKSGKTYKLVFKGGAVINSIKTIKANDKGLPDENNGDTVPPATVDDNWTNDTDYDPNAAFGTSPDYVLNGAHHIPGVFKDDPNNFGNEELKRQRDDARILREVQAQQAQASKPKPTPKHSGFVSFFGRIFAAGITGNTMDPAKCAEYGGVLVERERPGANGSMYFSCETQTQAGRGNVISVIHPLPTPTP